MRSCQQGSDGPVIDELRFLLPGDAGNFSSFTDDGQSRSDTEVVVDKGASLVNVTQGSMNSLYHMYPMFAYAAWAGPLQCVSHLTTDKCASSRPDSRSDYRPGRPPLVYQGTAPVGRPFVCSQQAPARCWWFSSRCLRCWWFLLSVLRMSVVQFGDPST
eukprot:TRINITY_DN16312_c1_g1_i1.p1 TRINITY_DN16312_c1_g1~~TRINITY_DN16312_c1_g1_i1.p1  ORF type:complete len:177 (-),score=6.84 TRINITY_DN16312_c1_g1_i1:307-783(-)